MNEVIFTEMLNDNGHVGLITLNRPKVLNALNQVMINAMYEKLMAWDNNNQIKAVIIQAAEGRAFCAGGDIRHVYEQAKRDQLLAGFFDQEYKLNSRIATFSKPYIALLNGITMGGGAGISIHGSHRVATENLTFAMPETSIGFFPDVGGSYFLSRLPHKIGFYLGLAAVRINAEDCMALKLTNHFITANKLSDVIQAIVAMEINSDAKSAVSQVLATFSQSPAASLLLEHKIEIENCFSKNSVEEILSALEKEDSEWCQQTAALLKTKSPTSLKVTLEELIRGEQLDFASCMRMEYCLAQNFLQGHDFFEGVRALIVDKDQAPKWVPGRLEEVTAEAVVKYFRPC